MKKHDLKWKTKNSRLPGAIAQITLMLVLGGLSFAPRAKAEGTWTPLSKLAPGQVGTMLLLTDGTVIGIGTDNSPTDVWYKLTPDASGHYTNGTWTTIAPMHQIRDDFASQVLQDGTVFVAGGEQGAIVNGTNSSNGVVYSAGATAEVYNPLSNLWTEVDPPFTLLNPNAFNACNFYMLTNLQDFHDMISETLPNGSVLMAPVNPMHPGDTLIYNPKLAGSNAWSFGGTLANGACNQDEASWVKLADGSILTIDPNTLTSERYIPSAAGGPGRWIADAPVPNGLFEGPVGGYGEEGAGFLLPNGNAIFIGSTPYTDLYIPSLLGGTNQGTWVPNPPSLYLPILPGSTNLEPMGAPDAPAAMMVNGKILCALSIGTSFKADTCYFYEFDYANTNAANPYGMFTQIHAPAPGNVYGTCGTQGVDSTDGTLMLDLPDGTVLYAGHCPANENGQQLWVYQPDGSPLAAGQPFINSVRWNADGSLHLTGARFTGISEGAAFGDDAQMATDYPIVQLTDTNQNVSYARTYNWSTSRIMTGTNLVTTEATLPAILYVNGQGKYSLQVSANGNASPAVTFYAPAWVNFNYNGSYQIGTFYFPYTTLAQATNAVAVGGTIAIDASIQPSVSVGTMTISKPMTLISVNGPSTIGL